MIPLNLSSFTVGSTQCSSITLLLLCQSLALRKMVANRDILEPLVLETSNLVREEEFGQLVQELGFLKVTCGQDNAQISTPIKVQFVIFL